MKLYIIDFFVGLIFILTVLLKRKDLFVKNRGITVAITITAMPFTVLILLLSYTYTLFNTSNNSSDVELLNYHIMNVELIILMIYMIYKCMKTPYSKLSKYKEVSKSIIDKDKVMKMLYLNIYISLLILLLLLLVIGRNKLFPDYDVEDIFPSSDDYYSSEDVWDFFLTFFVQILFFIIPYFGVQGLVIGSLIIIVTIWFAILLLLQYAMIINATIRMVKVSKQAKKLYFFYLFIMLIPIINIINCFLLIKISRKELLNEGCTLGLFGVKGIKEALV